MTRIARNECFCEPTNTGYRNTTSGREEDRKAQEREDDLYKTKPMTEKPYHIIHSNVDGAGTLPGQYTTFEEARDYAIIMQMVSDAGGNLWGYRYNVFGDRDRRLYLTKEGERVPIARITELARESNDSPYHLSRSIVSEIDRVPGEYTYLCGSGHRVSDHPADENR